MEQNPYRFLRPLTEGAVFLALSQAIDFLRGAPLPFGGEVLPGMLPVLVFALRWGVGPGAAEGVLYGLLRCLGDRAFGALPALPLLGDYVLGFALLGLMGLFRFRPRGLLRGTVLTLLLRYSALTALGVWLRPGEVPARYMGLAVPSPWAYYGLYEFITLGLNLVPALGLFALLNLPFGRFFRGEDLRAPGKQ